MNVNSFERITTKQAHSTFIRCLIQLSNRSLVSSANSNVIKFWCYKLFKCLAFVDQHRGKVDHIIELFDKNLASSAEDKSIMIWDTSSYNLLFTLKCQQRVSDLFQLCSGEIASRMSDFTIKLWSITSYQICTTLNLTDFSGMVGQLSNAFLISTMHNNKLQIMNMRNGRVITAKHNHSTGIFSIRQLHDGVIVTMSYFTIAFWNSTTLHCLQSSTDHFSFSCLTELIDGTLVVGGGDGSINVWSRGLKAGKEYMKTLKEKKKRLIAEHKDGVSSVIELSDGTIASSSFDKTIKIWRVNN